MNLVTLGSGRHAAGSVGAGGRREGGGDAGVAQADRPGVNKVLYIVKISQLKTSFTTLTTGNMEASGIQGKNSFNFQARRNFSVFSKCLISISPWRGGSQFVSHGRISVSWTLVSENPAFGFCVQVSHSRRCRCLAEISIKSSS